MKPAERESDIEGYLVQRVKELRGEIRKVKWIGRNAAPDRFVMLPTRQPNFWAELKAPGKDATPAQAREHERMRALDEIVYVLNSYEAVDKALGAKR